MDCIKLTFSERQSFLASSSVCEAILIYNVYMNDLDICLNILQQIQFRLAMLSFMVYIVHMFNFIHITQLCAWRNCFFSFFKFLV